MYAKNTNGLALTATSSYFVDNGAVVATTITATATTITTTVTRGSSAFTDTDNDRGFIGGIVQWMVPVDTSTITKYEVYIAYDDQNTYGAQLWDNILGSPDVPVGSNSLEIYGGRAGRQTVQSGYPANWVVVYKNGGSSIADRVAAIKLYDASSSLPDAITLSDLSFADQDTDAEQIGGTVSWSVPAQTDLGYVQEFEVYLADDAVGTNKESLGSVQRGTNQLSIADDTASGTKQYLLVYAKNTNGLAATATSAYFTDTGGNSPTTTITATVTTSTITTTWTGNVDSVYSVTYSDTDSSAGSLAGTVSWYPAIDTSGLVGYEVYIAYDEQGAYAAQLWSDDVESTFAVGTNQINIYTGTGRGTCCDSGMPANWLFVYTRSASGLQTVANAAKIVLYDESGAVPTNPSLTVAFDSDLAVDDATEVVSGTLKWTSGPRSL